MIYGATGHRLKYLGDSPNLSTNLNKFAIKRLEFLYPKPTHLVIGMAIGWDFAAAYAAIDHNITFTAAIPFVGQEKSWPDATKKEYYALLDKASKIHICSEGGYATWKYITRDKWMVVESQTMWSLWNGDEKTGTGATIKIANKLNKPWLNEWNNWLEFSQKNS